MSGTGSVVFDYGKWATRFPELAPGVTPAFGSVLFDDACLIVDNTACSIVRNLNQRAILLNYLVAHLATLFARNRSGSNAQVVGRISEATEGSVSLSTDMPDIPGTAAWFAQTQYGLTFWQMTAQYRTFRYIAQPGRYLGESYGGPPYPY